MLPNYSQMVICLVQIVELTVRKLFKVTLELSIRK